MKKLIISLMLLPLAISCSQDVTNVEPVDGGKGTIIIRSDVNVGVDDIVTRSVDHTTFALTLNGPDGPMTIDFPSDGIVSNLTPGEYTVTLTSHPDGIPDPAFDTPVYSGSKSGVIVEQAKTAEVEIVCTQINAGVYFVYDASLEELDLSVVPTITIAGDKSLTYSGADKERKGYFAPGQATVTIRNNGDIIPIGGQQSKTLTLEEKQLWKITLKSTNPNPNGHISIDVTVEVIDVTNEEEWDLGTPPEEPAEGFYLHGLEGQILIVNFTDGTFQNVMVGADGLVTLTNKEGTTIKSIQFVEDGPETLIGRSSDENFSLKFDTDGNVIFREADSNGFVPVGTVAEFKLIGANATNLGGSYLQEGDIDMASQNVFIGFYHYSASSQKPFTGVYDGGDFKVLNIAAVDTNTGNEGLGLFAFNKGTIQNVNVASGTVKANKSVGGICGVNNGTITNCTNAATILPINTSASQFGGICGVNKNTGSIFKCTNTGAVSGNCNYSGGIVGYNGEMMMTGAVVSECVNFADITITNTFKNYIGGIAGTNAANITGCKNLGDVTGTTGDTKWVGGIAGQNLGNSWIIGCYAICNIRANNTSGGIVGELAGAFSGRSTTVSGCYHVGTINVSGADKGALIGKGGNNTVVEYSYWSGNMATAYNTTTGTATELKYFTDGTTAPVDVVTGWPSEDAAKNWGLGGSTPGAEGKYWKNFGTSGSAAYPQLWWE